MLSFILSLFMCIRTYHVVIDRVGHYLCRRKLFLHKMWHSLWALFIFPFQISYLIKHFPLTGCQKRSHNNELGKHLFNLNVYYYSMSYHLYQHDLRLNEHIFNLKVFIIRWETVFHPSLILVIVHFPVMDVCFVAP